MLHLLQVLTLRQVAEMFVHAFPHCVENTETLLEDLAVQRQEPTKQDIIAAAANCPMTTEWAAIVQYWRMLQHSHCRDHQPIPRC